MLLLGIDIIYNAPNLPLWLTCTLCCGKRAAMLENSSKFIHVIGGHLKTKQNKTKQKYYSKCDYNFPELIWSHKKRLFRLCTYEILSLLPLSPSIEKKKKKERKKVDQYSIKVELCSVCQVILESSHYFTIINGY